MACEHNLAVSVSSISNYPIGQNRQSSKVA